METLDYAILVLMTHHKYLQRIKLHYFKTFENITHMPSMVHNFQNLLILQENTKGMFGNFFFSLIFCFKNNFLFLKLKNLFGNLKWTENKNCS